MLATDLTTAHTELRNRRVLLAQRPAGGLPGADTWAIEEAPVPDVAEGELLVKVLYVSLDPAMRMWINEGRSYIEPVAVGEVMRAIALGRVLASHHRDFAVGDHVSGLLGVQQYAIVCGNQLAKVDPTLVPLPTHLSALGMTGMTAYFGLLEIGAAQPGDTVVVSAAAGAVGSIAGQIAKIKGCRVVGIAGGPRKCRLLVEELGFDAAIDYKAQDVASVLPEVCPDRVDVYFDNVGGDVLDAVLTHLAHDARIVISGAISQYNSSAPTGPANYMALAVDRARMQGFIITDYASRFPEAARNIAAWVANGTVKSREHIVTGLDAFPTELLKLFDGQNDGKLILELADA
jgi:NADPH-dependent curcumin reductase CurA